MIEWFIILAFWGADGRLHKQASRNLPTQAICEQMLARDLADRRQAFGNATGVCVPTPPAPEGAKPAPDPKVSA